MEMKEQFCQVLSERAEGAGICLDDERTGKLYRFYQMLVETNRSFNLTAITEPEDVINKHFVDSLSVLPVFSVLFEGGTEMFHVKHSSPVSENLSFDPEMFHVKQSVLQKVMDIGTGAGFPGLPLAIVLPEVQFTLLDSLRKRVDFIRTVCEELGIRNVEAVHGRAEDYAHDPKYRERYDVVVSRAVANLSTLSEYCIPFIHKDGFFIPYKSGDVSEEVNNSEHALTVLNAQMCGNSAFQLPMTDISRTLSVIHKKSTTDSKYPRKAGIPERKPL